MNDHAEYGLVVSTLDRLCVTGISTYSNLVFPLVFRILIGCGSRITETLCIEKKDVDVGNGTISLLNTKNRKERIIPMAESLGICQGTCRLNLLELLGSQWLC